MNFVKWSRQPLNHMCSASILFWITPTFSRQIQGCNLRFEENKFLSEYYKWLTAHKRVPALFTSQLLLRYLLRDDLDLAELILLAHVRVLSPSVSCFCFFERQNYSLKDQLFCCAFFFFFFFVFILARIICACVATPVFFGQYIYIMSGSDIFNRNLSAKFA